jgi:hypothetical protein
MHLRIEQGRGRITAMLYFEGKAFAFEKVYGLFKAQKLLLSEIGIGLLIAVGGGKMCENCRFGLQRFRKINPGAAAGGKASSRRAAF